MSFCLNFPLFSVVACLVSAVLASVFNGRISRIWTICLSGVIFCSSLVILYFTYTTQQSYTYIMGHFPHPWGNEIRIGIMEAIYAALFSLVLGLCVLGGKRQLQERIDPPKAHYYYVLCDLILAALLVLVYTNDIFTGYVFIEICTLASIGILMIRENGRTILASVRYLIFSLIGSGLFLFGVVFLYNITGQLLMPNLKEGIIYLWTHAEYSLPLLTSICLITIGLAIKSGLFPFHLWMPDTYGAAISASSGILSGIISKGYIFFLIKLIYDVFTPDIFYACGIHNVVFVLGAVGVIMGSVGALQENNINRMVAYSSAAQIGYIYMGIGLSPVMGILAALFQIITHAITKPALFLSASQLSDAMGHVKKFSNLEGAGFHHVFGGAVFTFCSFSMIGLPLTTGFIAKYMFGVAAIGSTHIKMTPTLIVLAISTILNTLYFARTVIRIYSRPHLQEHPKVKAFVQKSFICASFIFIILNLFFGIFSKPFVELMKLALTLF